MQHLLLHQAQEAVRLARGSGAEECTPVHGFGEGECYAVVEEEAIELLTGEGGDTAQLHVGSERSHAGLLVKRDVT